MTHRQEVLSLANACNIPDVCADVISLVEVTSANVHSWLEWLLKEHGVDAETIQQQAVQVRNKGSRVGLLTAAWINPFVWLAKHRVNCGIFFFGCRCACPMPAIIGLWSQHFLRLDSDKAGSAAEDLRYSWFFGRHVLATCPP